MNKKVMKIEDFKVGDRIYEFKYSIVRQVLTIKRITKTLLILNNGTRLRVDGGYLNLYGGSIYSTASYYLETPQLKTEWEQHALSKKVESSIDKYFEKLDMADLEAIDQILEKYKENNHDKA